MPILKSSEYKIYSKFLNNLAKKLTRFYYSKLNKPFKVSNKKRGRGYDPVTSADKAFERFIRKEILKKFPNHQVRGEEFGQKKTDSDFTWIIDPIDGTRSFVIGNPTWSNLISLNFKGYPVLGLANFPVLKKYYLNTSNKLAYIIEGKKRKKIKVNKKVSFSARYDAKSQSFPYWRGLFEFSQNHEWLYLLSLSQRKGTLRENELELNLSVRLYSY